MVKSKSRKFGKSRADSRKRTVCSRGTASSKARKRPTSAPGSIAPKRKNRPDTKQAQVIAMLNAPAGATVDAMMRATGWQQHSVRGFLAAVVRKKLGLDLTSTADEQERVYRIVERPVRSAA